MAILGSTSKTCKSE